VFDPTIFDNWKVVLEGAMYDIDREGEAEVIGREDLMDLAALSRSFRIAVRRPGGNGRAEIRLASGLADFAGERYDLRLSDLEPPGIRLEVRFTLPGARIRDVASIHAAIAGIWTAADEETEVCHRVRIEVDPHAPPTSAAEDAGSSYEIAILFHRKRNEEHIGEIDVLQDKLLSSLDALEAS
jgi:hypothetical protein